jgi:hypothetical protein
VNRECPTQTFQTHRALYRGTVALILSLVVNVAFFAIAPLLLDRQIMSVFSRTCIAEPHDAFAAQTAGTGTEQT